MSPGSRIIDHLHFHIKLKSLYDLVSISHPTKSSVTTLYTESFATTNEFASVVETQGWRPVEISTMLVLLADLMSRPGPVAK
jgi:hypothetical protein